MQGEFFIRRQDLRRTLQSLMIMYFDLLGGYQSMDRYVYFWLAMIHKKTFHFILTVKRLFLNYFFICQVKEKLSSAPSLVLIVVITACIVSVGLLASILMHLYRINREVSFEDHVGFKNEMKQRADKCGPVKFRHWVCVPVPKLGMFLYK